MIELNYLVEFSKNIYRCCIIIYIEMENGEWRDFTKHLKALCFKLVNFTAILLNDWDYKGIVHMLYVYVVSIDTVL